MKSALIESESRVRPGAERVNLPGPSPPPPQTLRKHVCKRSPNGSSGRADGSAFVSETHKPRRVLKPTRGALLSAVSASGASSLLSQAELEVCVSRLFERSISDESHLSAGSR